MLKACLLSGNGTDAGSKFHIPPSTYSHYTMICRKCNSDIIEYIFTKRVSKIWYLMKFWTLDWPRRTLIGLFFHITLSCCTVYLRWLKSQNVCEFFYMFYAEYIHWQIIRKKVELIELSCDYYLKIHVLLENFKPLWKSLQEP